MQLKRIETLLVLVPVLLALVVGYLQTIAWSDRIGWDTVSYLDLAQAFRTGRFDLALSPYWSPLYPLLYACTSVLFGSLPERVSLSFFQYGCFLLFGVTAFYFWKTVLTAHQLSCKQDGIEPIPTGAICFFATSVSIYSSLVVGDLSVKSPDMLAAALFLLANGLILSGFCKTPTIGRVVLTGLVMGLTYLTKAFFISWIIPCLALLFWQRKQFHLDPMKFAVLTGTALLVVACYAVPLSVKLGYPSISETGKYQFVFCQTANTLPMIPLVHGTHEVAAGRITEQPKHPTRVFFESPRVYEFADVFDVVYPPWFNPHYWNEGFKIDFDWKLFAEMLGEKIMIVITWIGILSLFMMSYLAVLNKSFFPWSVERIKLFSPIVLTSKLCVLLLVITVIWPRYMIGLVPPLFAGIVLLCKYPDSPKGPVACGRMLNVTSILMLAVFSLTSLFHAYFAIPQMEPVLTKATGKNFPKKQIDPHGATASKLAELGIKPGDRVARISLKQDGEFYWMRLADVRVVCESVDAENFFKAPVESRNELYKKLSDFGVKAVILDWSNRTPTPGPVPIEDGWIQVPETGNYVRVLR